MNSKTDFNIKLVIQLLLFLILILLFVKIYFFLNIESIENSKIISLGSSSKSFIPCFKRNKIIFESGNNIFFNNLKSGDLIFVSYIKNFIKYNFVKFFCNSIWTHVCIFYKDPKTKENFILEAASYHPPYSSQFIKIPFAKWLNINRNQKLSVLPINKEIDVDLLLAEKDRLKYKFKDGYTVEDLNWRWFRFLFNRKKKGFFTRNHTQITCTEYVIKLYKKIGVLKPRFHSSSYYPVCLYTLRDIHLANGFSFGKPYLLKGYENNHITPY